MYDLHLLEREISEQGGCAASYWHWLYPPHFYLIHPLTPTDPPPTQTHPLKLEKRHKLYAAFRYDTDYRRVSYDASIRDDTMSIDSTKPVSSEPEITWNFEEFYEKVANETECISPSLDQSLLLLEPLLLIRKMSDRGPNLSLSELSDRSVHLQRNTPRKQQLTINEHNKIMRLTIGYVLAFFLLAILTFYIIYFVWYLQCSQFIIVHNYTLL